MLRSVDSWWCYHGRQVPCVVPIAEAGVKHHDHSGDVGVSTRWRYCGSVTLLHAAVTPGALLQLSWDASFNALAYVLSGSGRVGTAGRPIRSGQLVVMGAGDWFEVRGDDHQDSRSPTLELLVLSGKPIGEHVEMYGPFVIEGASTRVTPSRLSEIETQGSYDAAGRARDCSASRRSSSC